MSLSKTLPYPVKEYASRFRRYDRMGDLSKPDVVGLINNETDYDMGLPSLARRENITLIASKSNKDLLSIKLKWRPASQIAESCDKGLVVLSTKFQLKIGSDLYKHEEIVTYLPSESPVRPGRITNYGGQLSKLRLYITSPYRRARLVFNGRMTKVNDGSECYVRARFVVSPASGVFDFLDRIRCKNFFAADKKGSGPDKKGVIFVIDRHVQSVQIKGECFIGTNESKVRFCGWGFYSRHFLNDRKDELLDTKYVYAHDIYGRMFHIEQLRSTNNQRPSAQFGYTCFKANQLQQTIKKPFDFNWDEIDNNTGKFRIELSNENKVFVCNAKKVTELSLSLFDIDFNGTTGWAVIEMNDPLDSREELVAMQNNLTEYLADLDEGKICQMIAPDEECKSSKAKPLVVEIDDRSCTNSDLVGSKASSLAQLKSVATKHNYSVPSASVLTRHAHDLILEQNPDIRQAIIHLESLIGTGSSLENLQQECQRLQSLIAGTKLPGELCAALESSVGKSEHYKRSGAFAVRSSSWGEDEEDMSAAGQLSTYLGVRGADAIGAAVMKCFASKFSFENVEYKRQHGLRPSLPMAVVVQEMVECEKAGVMFTCDPTSGDTSVLTITANYGLGESVVSGQAEPDTIRVRVDAASNEPSIERVEVGQKKVIITDGEHSDHSGGREYDRSKCCLADDEILRLARCGLALAHYFQSARDIEWGFREGHLFMFQSRPVTGLDNCTDFELMHEADQPTPGERIFCTRANVGEVMPYAVTPLSTSSCFQAWSLFASRMNRRVPYHPECCRTSYNSSYHMFLTFMAEQSLLRVSGGGSKKFRAYSKVSQYGLFGHEITDTELIDSVKSIEFRDMKEWEMQLFRLITLDLRLTPFRVVRKHRRGLEKARANMQQVGKRKLDAASKLVELYNQFNRVQNLGNSSLRNHGLTLVINNQHNAALVQLLSKYVKDTAQLFNLMSLLLSQNPRVVISAEIPKKIDLMAQMIKSRGAEEVDRFLATQNPLDYIRDASNGELAKAFESFIDMFGHRCYNEFELASKSWKVEPQAVAARIHENCLISRAGMNGDVEMKSDAGNNRKAGGSVDEILSSNGVTMSWYDRMLLKHSIIPTCQLYVSMREATKDSMIYFTDLVREAIQMLAKELRLNLRIPDEDLIYYFFLSELEPLVRAPQPSLVLLASRRRNVFRKHFKEPWLFDEIVKDHWFTPNHLKPSKELDESLSKAMRLHGTPASSGRVKAKVCLVKGYTELRKVRAGDILVTHSTDIAFSPVFPLIAGIITEVGGLISHGAVVAREYGLPSLLGIPGVTQILQDGEEIVLDADQGIIFRLDAKQSL